VSSACCARWACSRPFHPRPHSQQTPGAESPARPSAGRAGRTVGAPSSGRAAPADRAVLIAWSAAGASAAGASMQHPCSSRRHLSGRRARGVSQLA
jgi:hypothetical protein